MSCVPFKDVVTGKFAALGAEIAKLWIAGEMTDAQMMTLALAAIVPLSMLLYSNSRITEAKETLRAESQLLRAEKRSLPTAPRTPNRTRTRGASRPGAGR